MSALRWNPQDRELICHKGTPFDHVSLMISTNQKPGFLALGQWKALILQKFMSTFHTKVILTYLSEPQGGGTEMESTGRGNSMELLSLRLPTQGSNDVRTTGRGH